MKKVFLLWTLLIAAVANATLYTVSDDGYSYTGTPVDAFSVDFTSWTADSLPATWLDADAAAEAGGMAFIKERFRRHLSDEVDMFQQRRYR